MMSRESLHKFCTVYYGLLQKRTKHDKFCDKLYTQKKSATVTQSSLLRLQKDYIHYFTYK